MSPIVTIRFWGSTGAAAALQGRSPKPSKKKINPAHARINNGAAGWPAILPDSIRVNRCIFRNHDVGCEVLPGRVHVKLPGAASQSPDPAQIKASKAYESCDRVWNFLERGAAVAEDEAITGVMRRSSLPSTHRPTRGTGSPRKNASRQSELADMWRNARRVGNVGPQGFVSSAREANGPHPPRIASRIFSRSSGVI